MNGRRVSAVLSVTPALGLCLSFTRGVTAASADTWTQMNTDGFGDFNNIASTAIAVSGSSSVTVGTRNTKTGCQVWYSQELGGTPYEDWSKINSIGFGSKNNSPVSSMSDVRNSTTYTDMRVGTYNDSSGCEIWLLSGGNWSRISNRGFRSATDFNAYGLHVNTGQGSRRIRVDNGGGTPGGARAWNNYGEGPPPPNPPTWHLAEGRTNWRFVTWSLIQNPNDSAVDVTVTSMTSSGPNEQPEITIPRRSRASPSG